MNLRREPSGLCSARVTRRGIPPGSPTSNAHLHRAAPFAAIASRVIFPRQGMFRPIPRLSKLSVWKFRVRPSACGRQPSPIMSTPWIISTGGPLPASSHWNSATARFNRAMLGNVLCANENWQTARKTCAAAPNFRHARGIFSPASRISRPPVEMILRFAEISTTCPTFPPARRIYFGGSQMFRPPVEKILGLA